jgi:hypothetical protein
LIGLLAWAGGCGPSSPRSAEHAEVSGKVLIDNKPLPGGEISFVTVKGGFASSGKIDENGNYQVKAPVGEVTITVNNGMLQNQQPRRGKGPGGGGAAPKELPHTKQAAPDVQPTKGHWVSIPSRYSNADSSDLKYTVKEGPQTYDVKLSSAPPPPK